MVKFNASKITEMTIEERRARMAEIDKRVASLEKAADSYMLSHGGEWSEKIYNDIQSLMDERDAIFKTI